jgi:hypothetical protein
VVGWFHGFISLQQAKYKKVLRAIEKEMEEGAPRADTGEIQKRDQQKSIKPHSQRYRENYSIGTFTSESTIIISSINHQNIPKNGDLFNKPSASTSTRKT